MAGKGRVASPGLAMVLAGEFGKGNGMCLVTWVRANLHEGTGSVLS